MKQLGFVQELIPLVLSGEKYITWRSIPDDKDLSVGDIVECVEAKTLQPFAKIKLITVKITTFGNMTEDDRNGHEKFSSEKELYDTYSRYFGQNVTKDTPVKVIKFKLI